MEVEVCVWGAVEGGEKAGLGRDVRKGLGGGRCHGKGRQVRGLGRGLKIHGAPTRCQALGFHFSYSHNPLEMDI